MKLTAAIAPDGDQCHVTDLPKPVINPQTLQELVDKLGACFNKLLRGDAGIKCASEPALEDIHMRLDTGAGQILLGPDARVIGLVG